MSFLTQGRGKYGKTHAFFKKSYGCVCHSGSGGVESVAICVLPEKGARHTKIATALALNGKREKEQENIKERGGRGGAGLESAVFYGVSTPAPS